MTGKTFLQSPIKTGVEESEYQQTHVLSNAHRPGQTG